ncbi:MAG: hypothetical protein ACOYZ6_05920 [Chloroflexota bacterium]
MIAKEFEIAIEGWQEKLQTDEWYFVQLREDLIKNSSLSELFSAIDDVVDLIFKQQDEFLIHETFLLLFDIYRKIGTAERTFKLINSWTRLKQHMEVNDTLIHQFHEFERWFGNKIQQA